MGATFNSHRRVANTNDDNQFIKDFLRPAEQYQKGGPAESAEEEGNVAGLYDVLSESDITASTSGEDVTQQQHSIQTMQQGLEEDEEETSETGFFATSAGGHGKVGSTDYRGNPQAHDGRSKLGMAPASAIAALSNVTRSSGMTGQHLKIFVAELQPKYNLDIFEALHGLGDLTGAPEVGISAQFILPAEMSRRFG